MADAARAAALERAKKAAKQALQEARERAVYRSELASTETYMDAWARYALSLEERLRWQTASAPGVGSGNRPHPLPPSSVSSTPGGLSQEKWQALAETEGPEAAAESLCASTAASLQKSLGTQSWQWHEEAVGAAARVPLSWLAQIESGVRLLQAAAEREPTLRMQYAEQKVRADAAEEESARRLAMVRATEDELVLAESREADLIARVRELEGLNTGDYDDDDDGAGDDDEYRPFDGNYEAFEEDGVVDSPSSAPEEEVGGPSANGAAGAAGVSDSGGGSGWRFWNRGGAAADPPE
jgi:hypothetical protein